LASSRTEPLATDVAAGDLVVLGKVVDAYGIRGALRIHPFADDPAAWAKLPAWRFGRDGEAPENWRELEVLRACVHVDVVVAEVAGVTDRSGAEAMHGLLIGVPRSALPAAAENEYYWADLIGLEVVNTHDESLGRVLGLIETGANDVLRVGAGEQGSGQHGEERLLPFVASVVLEVELAAGRIRVDWEADW
jgi:16S rRNA processing protein RimM